MVVKRTHTAENVAPAIATLRDQFNAAYPDRLRTTVGHDADGIWPSKLHTQLNPNSDHEAGNALDIDDDLSGDPTKAPQVTPAMAALISKDSRCNYTIHDATIYRDGVGTPYTGSSAHTGHMHISVYEAKRDDGRAWDIGGDDMLSLDYRHIVITDLGDPAHRAFLKSAAGTRFAYKEGANTFSVDAMKGEKADVFLDYAYANGLDVETINTYRGQAATMVQRNVGSVPVASCDTAQIREHAQAIIGLVE